VLKQSENALYNYRAFLFKTDSMKQFLFKPGNYSRWSILALEKIKKTIDSCITQTHLESAKNMVEHYILTISLNEDHSDIDISDISDQLYLYLNLKQSNLH
jgi:hypothetical protein